MRDVILKIPQEILDSARLSPSDASLELALTLYAQSRLAIGKACELAGLSLWEFRQQLAARRIPCHFDVDDLDQDLKAIKQSGL